MSENQTDLSTLNLSQIDFFDIGCNKGGSLRKYGAMFGATDRGIGIDINIDRVVETQRAGFSATQLDLADLDVSLHEGQLRFCTMIHVLEHIPSHFRVRTMIQNACRLSQEFVFIKQPWFDADPMLFRHGLKFLWSNWEEHPNRMTLLELRNILQPFLEAGMIRRYSLYGADPISDSRDVNIHPLTAPPDQEGYDEAIHPPKSLVKFDQPVYKDAVAILDIAGDRTEWIESRLAQDSKIIRLYDSLNPEAAPVEAARPDLAIRLLRRMRRFARDIMQQ